MITAITEGLKILALHFDHPDAGKVRAYHDVIKVFPTQIAMTEYQVGKLKKLGWVQEHNGLESDPYDTEKAWYLWI